MTRTPKPASAKSASARRSREEARAAERAILEDIDATLARIEIGIAAEREKMDRLLERMIRPGTT
jgi:hypothetical protein